MFGGIKNKTKAGLLGPNGQNLLPMTPKEFDTFMNNLCGTDRKVDAVNEIKAIIAQAAQLQEMNANPTTNPKCYSVPFIQLDRHCNVNVEWRAGSDDEMDCGA
jgi:hypothetical protein